MTVELWIDEITALAGGISNGKGGKVQSYSVFRKDNFPEALSVFPCALTYPVDVTTKYSHSGPHIHLWTGITEFHITPDVKKNQMPDVIRFFARIQAAFAAHMTLGGKVAYCLLRNEEGPSILGPVKLQYGSEQEHFGLIAHWVVKELSTLSLGD